MSTMPQATPHLLEELRSSLEAKLERVLRRPVIAQVVPLAAPDDDAEEEEQAAAIADDEAVPPEFAALFASVGANQPKRGAARRLDPWATATPEGGVRVGVRLDYNDLWRGREREVVESVDGAVEGTVALLTEAQKLLLERSPREFLALNPRPETVELVGYQVARVGGADRVVSIDLASRPEAPLYVRYVVIVPNLVPLQRQLDALCCLEQASPGGPLAPLRALVGLSHEALSTAPREAGPGAPIADQTRLDPHQLEAFACADAAPHFAVLRGPPGSGKTTVITTIVRAALTRGERVLIVSPTHVAVDNVVETLTSGVARGELDTLEPYTLPVRFAARDRKLLPGARLYWVGPKRQVRAGTIAKRLERCLTRACPGADRLWDRVDPDRSGFAPLSRAVSGTAPVICGTPIGLLSYDPVKLAAPADFDLLIVDEVSKLTLPEFLATAVKARRWVLVGDPDQLPPFNNTEENAETLDEVFDAEVELVCSVGAVLDRVGPGARRSVRVVVVARDPERVADAVRAHFRAVGLMNPPPVHTLGPGAQAGVLVCAPTELQDAVSLSSPSQGRDRSWHSDHAGSVQVLVERGVSVARPVFASGSRLIEPRARAQAVLFETMYAVYHAQPWAQRSEQKATVVQFRNGIDKYLPSTAALAALGVPHDELEVHRAALVRRVADRYLLNAVSVFDLLAGMPTDFFDTTPLQELAVAAAGADGLRRAVAPFVATLRKQYRMHPSLSLVPRRLFYFGEALEDGRPTTGGACRVRLAQVAAPGGAGESNAAEVSYILKMLGGLAAVHRGDQAASLLLITPYREQERRLNAAIHAEEAGGRLGTLNVEVCTLDRCQGREADLVIISLVRNKATVFLDAPKRWNVALTRAKLGLFIVGDIDAFLEEARRARRAVVERPELQRPMMSVPARFLEAYDQQLAGVAKRGA
jgi:hypothetical protein